MADGAGTGRGSALRLLSLASCSCRLLVPCSRWLPASSAGVNQWQPLGMCRGSRCVAAPVRLSQPAMESSLAVPAMVRRLQWSWYRFRPALALKNSSFGASQLPPDVCCCLVVAWLRCEPGVTLPR